MIRLIDCDKSDMLLWAQGPCADSFIGAVTEIREQMMRELVSQRCYNRDEVAAIVRAYDKVIGLFGEAREMK